MSRLARGRARTIAALALLFAGLAAAPPPAEDTIDLAALTRETQRQAQADNVTQIVQWVPADVWDVAMRQQNVPDAVRESKLDQIAPYLVFLVGEVRVGPAGGLGYATAKELASRTTVSLGVGEAATAPRKPVENETLPPAVRDFLASVVPAAANAANFQLHALVFEDLSDAGLPLVDPRKRGRITLAIGERRFEWRLPLGSLLAPKRCPKDGETFPGDFNFCPYHGNRLIEAPTPKPEAN